MLDHISIRVRDLDKAKKFYAAALKPLGYEVGMEFEGGCGFGVGKFLDFWLGKGEPGYVHLAFSAKTHAEVDAFHAAAIEAGAKDNGKPGLRAEYHPKYYGAFVYDLDGNNVEVVCHK